MAKKRITDSSFRRTLPAQTWLTFFPDFSVWSWQSSIVIMLFESRVERQWSRDFGLKQRRKINWRNPFIGCDKHKRLINVKSLKQTQQRGQGFISSRVNPCFHALVGYNTNTTTTMTAAKLWKMLSLSAELLTKTTNKLLSFQNPYFLLPLRIAWVIRPSFGARREEIWTPDTQV